MGFFETLAKKHQTKVQERNAAYDHLISYIDEVLNDSKALFSDPEAYIDPKNVIEWNEKSSEILAKYSKSNLAIKMGKRYRELHRGFLALSNVSQSIPSDVSKHNKHALSILVPRAYEIVDTVEGRKLDEQQMSCIVKDVHNHLVIAGAGTGKTTTVVGKIKYLLKTNKCSAYDILVLSFTNASASEMRERISAETGFDIAAMTFHKLGLSIIAEVNGVMPKITQLNLRRFVKELLNENMKSSASLIRLLSFFLSA